MASAPPPPPTGLPAPGATASEVWAFWQALAAHPTSPWLTPALTATEAHRKSDHAPSHTPVARWASMVLKYPDGETSLRTLITQGTLPLEAADPPHGFNLTEAALLAGKTELFDWLLARGAPPPTKTPLFIACGYEHATQVPEFLQSLHRSGVPFNNLDGLRALERVFTEPKMPTDHIRAIVRTLLACGARASLDQRAMTPPGQASNLVLLMAATRFPDLLKPILDSAPFHQEEASIALMHAARAAEPSSIHCLLDAGVVPVRSESGRTLLMEVVQGHFDRRQGAGWRSDSKAAAVLESVDLLLAAGFRSDADGVVDKFDLFPISLACGARWLELTMRMLPTAHGAWANPKQAPLLYTLLNSAPESHMLPWLETALSQGVNVNSCDTIGRTALHFALGEDRTPMIRALIEHGAELHTSYGMVNSAWNAASPSQKATIETWRAAKALGQALDQELPTSKRPRAPSRL